MKYKYLKIYYQGAQLRENILCLSFWVTSLEISEEMYEVNEYMYERVNGYQICPNSLRINCDKKVIAIKYCKTFNIWFNFFVLHVGMFPPTLSPH